MFGHVTISFAAFLLKLVTPADRKSPAILKWEPALRLLPRIHAALCRPQSDGVVQQDISVYDLLQVNHTHYYLNYLFIYLFILFIYFFFLFYLFIIYIFFLHLFLYLFRFNDIN